MKKHIPNILTLARLVLALASFGALAFMNGILSAARNNPLLTPADFAALEVVIRSLIATSLATFVLAAVTDFFDGWLARRWKVTSTFGAIMDPIADKILVCGGILSLTAVNVPGVLIPGALILFREFAVSALREVIAPKGITLPVTFLAKTKTALQLAALIAVMVFNFWGVWGIAAPEAVIAKALMISNGLLWFAAVITLWTGLEYGFAARKALKGTVAPVAETAPAPTAEPAAVVKATPAAKKPAVKATPAASKAASAKAPVKAAVKPAKKPAAPAKAKPKKT